MTQISLKVGKLKVSDKSLRAQRARLLGQARVKSKSASDKFLKRELEQVQSGMRVVGSRPEVKRYRLPFLVCGITFITATAFAPLLISAALAAIVFIVANLIVKIKKRKIKIDREGVTNDNLDNIICAYESKLSIIIIEKIKDLNACIVDLNYCELNSCDKHYITSVVNVDIPELIKNHQLLNEKELEEKVLDILKIIEDKLGHIKSACHERAKMDLDIMGRILNEKSKF